MFDERKQRAAGWFRDLRNDICRELQRVEDDAPDDLYPGEPGRFTFEPWLRKVENGGGGTGGMLRGRVFEKCGVHISAVQGEFTEEMAARVPGADEDPRFWAAGISLICHPRNPRMPAVHMNTRYIVTTQDWFGGGADLTPVQHDQRNPETEDARHFHAAMRAPCDAHGRDWERYRDWCDEYFHLHHRDEPRGVGGIFYDRVNSGDWDADFAFTQDVGRAFIDAYIPIARRRMMEPWSEAEREEQLILRGRYVEFNLLWDRGTTFGLKTGGNVKTILSSMPPVVKWP